LGDIRLITEAEKASRIDQVDKKLKMLEESLFEYQDVFTKKINGLKENTNILTKKVVEDKDEHDKGYNDDMQDISLLEKKLQSITDKERIRRRDYETRLLNSLDEKVYLLKGEIQKENQIMIESFGQLNQVYESDLSKLQTDLNQDIEEREENDSKIWEYTSIEIKKLNEVVIEYKNTKEDGEQKVYNTIREAVARIKSWIDDERETREVTHEKMINVLEESCKNLTRAEYE